MKYLRFHLHDVIVHLGTNNPISFCQMTSIKMVPINEQHVSKMISIKTSNFCQKNKRKLKRALEFLRKFFPMGIGREIFDYRSNIIEQPLRIIYIVHGTIRCFNFK